MGKAPRRTSRLTTYQMKVTYNKSLMTTITCAKLRYKEVSEPSKKNELWKMVSLVNLCKVLFYAKSSLECLPNRWEYSVRQGRKFNAVQSLGETEESEQKVSNSWGL